MRRAILPLAAALLLASCGSSPDRRALDAGQQQLVERMRQAGATALAANGRPDGGMSVGGKLAGRAFGIAVPARWNGQVVLFANGYSTPGTPVGMAPDPIVSEHSGGFLTAAYRDGFAVGESAYDKSGMGVQSAVANTMRLRGWFAKLGAKRFYISGGSMGGNITLALIEKYPDAFSGAMAACGVTGGWEEEIGHLVDLRAAYDYFTRGTDYALPGEADITRNGVSPVPPAGLGFARPAWLFWQMRRTAGPIAALFKAARGNPDGPEARMVARIASVADADADPGSFIFPIMTAMVGMDDMRASFGGLIYGNRDKAYSSPLLDAAQTAALNRGIQRNTADPAAVAYARQWYRPTGRFRTPLIAVHNPHDGLVFADQATILRVRVAAAGNQAHLFQLWAPSQQKDIPTTGLTGWAHCGFTPRQTRVLWSTLRHWVETGQRPPDGRY
ncbi:MAG: prolyl oligopeptidase family serine peptidase [Sphingomonas bacterium]